MDLPAPEEAAPLPAVEEGPFTVGAESAGLPEADAAFAASPLDQTASPASDSASGPSGDPAVPFADEQLFAQEAAATAIPSEDVPHLAAVTDAAAVAAATAQAAEATSHAVEAFEQAFSASSRAAEAAEAAQALSLRLEQCEAALADA